MSRKQSKNKERPPTSTPTIRERARPYVSLLMRGKDLDKEVQLRLKREPDSVLDAVLTHTKGATPKLLGLVQPRSATELGGEFPTEFSDDLECELRWAVATARKYRREIKSFLALKEEVERFVLVADWRAADDAKATLDNDLGISLWSIELGFYIKQQTGGLEANRTFLKDLTKTAASGWVKVLWHFFSQKAEDQVSRVDYEANTEVLKADPRDGAPRKRFRGYLQFRINPLRSDANDHLPFFLYMEEATSVFDRYLLLRTVLQKLLSKGTALNPRTLRRIRQLSQDIADVELDRLLALADPASLDPETLDPELFAQLDLYTRGEYDAICDRPTEMLSANPQIFDYYEIRGKASARVARITPKVFPDNSPAQQILEDIRLVAEKGSDRATALDRLNKLALQFDQCGMGLALNEFCLLQSNVPRPVDFQREIPVPVGAITPKMCAGYRNVEDGLLFAAQMKSQFPNNVAVQLFDRTLQSIQTQQYLQPPEGLPQSRIAKYRAYILERLGKYDEALAAYSDVARQNGPCRMDSGDALFGRYRCLLQVGRFGECAMELATAGMANPFVVSSAALLELLAKYPYRGKHKQLKGKIGWPVLFSMAQDLRYTAPDTHRVYQVLDDFLTAWDIRRPSELRNLPAFNQSLLVYLLRFVCVVEVCASGQLPS